MLGMDSDDVEYCALCGKGGNVAGANADQCLQYDSCSALLAQGPVAENLDVGLKDISFDPWYIVQGEMNVASDKPVDEDLFRNGLRSFFVANESRGVQVTAYSMEPDQLFADMMPGLKDTIKPAPGLDATHQTSTPMKVVFLVNDKDQAAAIKDALDNPDSEEHENMLLYLEVRVRACVCLCVCD